MTKIHGYPVTTDRSKRVKRNQLPVERRRKINDYDARRLNKRAVANAAGGCLTSITATLATGVALVAVVWKVGRR